jgi:hypothetical protein
MAIGGNGKASNVLVVSMVEVLVDAARYVAVVLVVPLLVRQLAKVAL